MERDKNLETKIEESIEGEKRFKLVIDFMEERMQEIQILLEDSEVDTERVALQEFLDKGKHAVIDLGSKNGVARAKTWLEEYKHDLALRVKMPTGRTDEGEVIDAIISTIDQEPN